MAELNHNGEIKDEQTQISSILSDTLKNEKGKDIGGSPYTGNCQMADGSPLSLLWRRTHGTTHYAIIAHTSTTFLVQKHLVAGFLITRNSETLIFRIAPGN